MSQNPYPVESLAGDDDNGTMPENVETLASHVVGRKIVSVEKGASVHNDLWGTGVGTLLTLDNGKQVILENTTDCCAFTEINNVILHLDKIDHVITGVGTTEEFDRWHIYADLGDVVELEVEWSCGNPFYYGYGFDITVRDIPGDES